MEVEAPTSDEVDNIIRNLNNNKSPGITTITAEMVGAGGEMLHERIHALIKKIRDEERLPDN